MDANETIRANLANAVNDLNKLIPIEPDPAQRERLRRVRRAYFALFEEVIKQVIDRNSVEFEDSIEELQLAQKTLRTAKGDIEGIAEAIRRAVIAAKAVDKIVKVGVDVLL